MKRLLVIALLLLTAGTAGAWATLQSVLRTPIEFSGSEMTISVKRGDSLRAVLSRMAQDGVIAYPKVLGAYARWQGLDRHLKVGEYVVGSGGTPLQLLHLFNRGDVKTYTLTLPEGITAAQALARIQNADGVLPTLTDLNDSAVKSLIAPFDHPEGLFLPETYQYVRGDTDLQLLERAHELMMVVLDDAWRARAENLPIANRYDALILASIVEKETAVAEERAQIAGVFTRRLRLGMRLQTDPTVIYGLGLSFDGNLTRRHLRDSGNLWNTYALGGLPPTPIALPGKAAIRAALMPAAGESLYFVARGDGYHAFASTLDEHNRNVAKYQNKRREDYRSTPR